MDTQASLGGRREAPASPGGGDDDDDDGAPELPLTMSASAVLAELPRDAAAALASAAGAGPAGKVVVRFKPVGAAPALAQDLCKITATRRFEEVVRYLRRKLRCGPSDSVFLYVNSAFAPSLDEVVGNLHQVRPPPGKRGTAWPAADTRDAVLQERPGPARRRLLHHPCLWMSAAERRRTCRGGGGGRRGRTRASNVHVRKASPL